MKSGVRPELVQSGRKGPEIWQTEDGSKFGAPSFEFARESIGTGKDLAVTISLARHTEDDVKSFVSKNVTSVDTLLICILPACPDQAGVFGD